VGREDDHVTLLREAYLRWGESKGGSVQYWLDRMTDDVSYRSLSGGSSGGSPAVGFECATPGKSAVEAYLAQITSEWEMVHYTPREYVAKGDRVAVPGDCAWRSPSRSSSPSATARSQPPSSCSTAPPLSPPTLRPRRREAPPEPSSTWGACTV